MTTPHNKTLKNILLVEDDPLLGRGFVINLELEGYKPQWVQDLASARLQNIESGFDLVILDLGLPDGHGFDFLKLIRQKNLQLPVLILTAVTDEDSVVEGLMLGANDYVKKPFSTKEILARMQVALRKPGLINQKEISYKDLSLSRDHRQAKYLEQMIDLNRREFDILYQLVLNAEKVVTRDYLLQSLDKDGEIFDRTIDSHISHLRSRLKNSKAHPIKISSVYGVGYRLEKNDKN